MLNQPRGRRAQTVVFSPAAADLRRRTLLSALSTLPLLGLAVLAGCGGIVERRLERNLVEALQRNLGPAERYEATVRGAAADASHVDEVQAAGIRVARPRTPLLDRIEARLLDVSVSGGAARVVTAGEASATLRLRADDLAAWLQRQPWIEAPAVRFDTTGAMTLSGRMRLPGLAPQAALEAECRGRLLPRGSQLRFGVETLRLGDREMPAFARGLVEAAINPLVDTAEYAVPSQVDSVRIDGDALVVTASGRRTTLRRGGGA